MRDDFIREMKSVFGSDKKRVDHALAVLNYAEQIRDVEGGEPLIVKAVAVLLALLCLGVKNIKLGPSMPAFVSPGVLKILVERFNISPIGNVDEDLAAMLK
jgi:hypothetical protein